MNCNELFYTMFKRFIQNSSLQTLTNDSLDNDTFLFAVHDQKFYLMVSKINNTDEVILDAKIAIFDIIENRRLDERSDAKYSYNENQISANMKFNFTPEKSDRAIAKIAFNALASVIGKYAVLHKGFDPIRKAIVTGRNVEQFVKAPDCLEKYENPIYKTFEMIQEKTDLQDFYHAVTFVLNPEHGLNAMVSLYTTKTSVCYSVYLGKYKNISLETGDSVICNWQSGKGEESLIYWIKSFCDV